jgi:hypothetical protein
MSELVKLEVKLTMLVERESKPAHWDWSQKLGLVSGEHVEVTSYKAVPYDADLPESMPLFDGETFDLEFDYERLGAQMQAVYDVMEDGRWHFLAEMSEIVGAPEGSISARLRDLRKSKFGGFVVERKRMGTTGHYAYRLKQPSRQIA